MADFIKKFSEIRLAVIRADIANWMNSDGPGYEYLSDLGIVDLVLDNKKQTKTLRKSIIYNQTKVQYQMHLQWRCFTAV